MTKVSLNCYGLDNAPTSLEALAKLMRGAVSAGVIKQHSAEIEIIQWADTIDEYLAARPASDLGQRLREMQQKAHDRGDFWTAALLLEAADALACDVEIHQQRNDAEAALIAANARFAELERDRDSYQASWRGLVEVSDENLARDAARIAELERMLRDYTDLRTAEALKERDAQALRAAELEARLAAVARWADEEANRGRIARGPWRELKALATPDKGAT